jgi:hypothetical protein
MSLLWISTFVVVMALSVPASAQAPQPANDLSKGVAGCLLSARSALGGSQPDAEKIDAYSASGKIYFNNPFVNQNPTFAFWKCLRLKGYAE